MIPYIVVIQWRTFSWTLRVLAPRPDAIRGLIAHFGDEPITLQVMRA